MSTFLTSNLNLPLLFFQLPSFYFFPPPNKMPSLYTRAMTDLNSCPNSSVKCNTAPGDTNPSSTPQQLLGRQPQGAYVGLAIVLVLILLAFIGWVGFGGGAERFTRFWARLRNRRKTEDPKNGAPPTPNPDKESVAEDHLVATGRGSSESIKQTESSSVHTLGDRLPSIPEEPRSPPPGKTSRT